MRAVTTKRTLPADCSLARGFWQMNFVRIDLFFFKFSMFRRLVVIPRLNEVSSVSQI